MKEIIPVAYAFFIHLHTDLATIMYSFTHTPKPDEADISTLHFPHGQIGATEANNLRIGGATAETGFAFQNTFTSAVLLSGAVVPKKWFSDQLCQYQL